MAAFLGIIGFVLLLFAIGAFMESNLRKMAGFGVAFLVCAVLIIATGPKGGQSQYDDCYIDWDGRSNSEVCE